MFACQSQLNMQIILRFLDLMSIKQENEYENGIDATK